jgi:hypothetical protein
MALSFSLQRRHIPATFAGETIFASSIMAAHKHKHGEQL